MVNPEPFKAEDFDGDELTVKTDDDGDLMVTAKNDAGFVLISLEADDAARLRDWLTEYLKGVGK